MIRFLREGTEVVVSVDSKANVEKRFFGARWNANSELIAELIMRALEKVFDSAIENAHQEAYEKGYADGRGKKRKATGFSCYLDSNERCW